MNRLSRSKHQKIWEDYYNKTIPKGNHIHHIDCDNKNNIITNLMCVSPEEHFWIHYDLYLTHGKREDLAACNFLKKHVKGFVSVPSIMKGYKHTEKSKLKMSQSRKGNVSWNKGLPHSDEHKENLSKSLKGRIWSDEHKENFAKSRKGKTTKKAKPFIFYGIRYRCLRDCENDICRSTAYISRRLASEKYKDCYYE